MCGLSGGADGCKAVSVPVGNRLPVYPYLPVTVFGMKSCFALVFIRPVRIRSVIGHKGETSCFPLIETCQVEIYQGRSENETGLEFPVDRGAETFL